MTLVSEIIRQAFRETNVVSIGQDATPPEVSEGLSRLQSLVLSTLGNEVGYIMEDWVIKSPTDITKPSSVPLTLDQTTAYTVTPNSRLVCGLDITTVVKLDPFPQDGQRFSVVDATNSFGGAKLNIDSNGRKFEGTPGITVLGTEGMAKQWLYRADLADWRPIDPLTVEDDMPFPADFDDYFIISLAARLNPRYGQQMSQESGLRLEQQRQQIVARYTQTRLIVPTPAE